MYLDGVASPSRAGRMGVMHEQGPAKLATLLLSRLLSPQLISGAALLQPITALTRVKYSSVNLILFTFHSHLEGIN